MGVYFRKSKSDGPGTWWGQYKPDGAPAGTLKRINLHVQGIGNRAEAELAFRKLTGRPAARKRPKAQRRRIARATWEAVRDANGRPACADDAMQLWKEHLRRGSHMKRSSVDAYLVQVRRWQERWAFHGLEHLDEAELRTYFEERSELNLAKSTLKAEVQVMRSFLGWCRERGWIERVPALPRIRGVSKRLPRPLSDDELGALFKALDSDPRPQVRALRPFVMVQLHCGLRREEARFLRWSDVDVVGRELRVTDKPPLFTVKDHEERSIPVNGALLEFLQAERERSRSEWVAPNDHLGRWSLGIGKWMRELFTAAGVYAEGELGTSHRFRHTFATRLLHAGVDIATVSALMGHSDVAVTSRYLGVSPNRHRAVEALAALGA